jgi:hypothetical protein
VNAHACCEGISTGSSGVTAEARIVCGGPRTLAWRCREAAGWIIPGGILALLPKCPVCLAAYFAIGSGIGVSMATATYVRRGLVILCVGLLSYFAVRRGRRLFALRMQPPKKRPRPC